MTTNYFTQEDHAALRQPSSAAARHDLQPVCDKLCELHATLHRRMRDRQWDLHPHWQKSKLICTETAASTFECSNLVLPYARSKDQAELVERLMGRDGAELPATVDIRRHPVIELRLMPDHFAVELVMSPMSWWDQQNLIGKLAVSRHRSALHSLLQKIDGDFLFGFWGGSGLNEMHLSSRQLSRAVIFDEWMSTFAEGRDWLRFGVWYEPEDPALSVNNILSELLHRMSALYSIYTFALWTSNNNFQSFYKSARTYTNGRDHHSRL